MKEFKILTEEDRTLYNKAAMDLETGNYLLHTRNVQQLKAIQDIIDASNAIDPNERQKKINEWVRVCTDFDYAKANGYIDSALFGGDE